MGDRVALMRKGRVVQTGKALDLYRAPKDILAARTFSDLNETRRAHRAGKRRDPARPLRRQRACPTAPRPSSACGSAACACSRPEQGVPARVLDARFLGDIALVEVAVQGLDAPLLARVKESDVPPQGAEIGVGIDRGAVLVFQADNGDRPSP